MRQTCRGCFSFAMNSNYQSPHCQSCDQNPHVAEKCDGCNEYFLKNNLINVGTPRGNYFCTDCNTAYMEKEFSAGWYAD